MVYTCFEMIRDCRADLPQGWRHFAASYIPVIRRILVQYTGSDSLLNTMLVSLRQPQSSIFQSVDMSPERQFLAELRQAVLGRIAVSEPEIPLELASLADALAPLTMVEKQAAWFETMRYDPAATAEMLRISPATVEKIRARAAELIRGKADAWRRTLLADNGLMLAREAAAAANGDCLPPKAFLDILDGRTTWRNRELMEQQVNRCWHCVDHFCRMVEVVGLLRECRPLSDAEAAPYWKLLDVEAERSFWKRLTRMQS
jgi:hypothetical protein